MKDYEKLSREHFDEMADNYAATDGLYYTPLPRPLAMRRRRCSKESGSALCQTGIIRTRFSAADFRLNRVIRLANTGKVLAAPTSLLSQKSVGAELLAPQSKRFSDDVARAERRQ